MTPFIECVPNFSEGRDAQVLAELAAAIAAVPGVQLLDIHADPTHHRSVFTFCGEPDPVLEAALAAAAVAVRRIDLTRHHGVHPRMGAMDVVPFVPLTGATMDDCVSLARRFGGRVADALEIPVYYYARAATRETRIRLRDIRRGGFEELLPGVVADPDFVPDAGPARLHRTAGAVAVGARSFLVAYNVELATDDLALGREIARAIRASSGGLHGVQALAFPLDGRVQISTNIVDIEAATPQTVFDAVQHRAQTAGVEILRSEIVGLAPERALARSTAESLALDVPLTSRLLEPRILGLHGPAAWLDALAAPTAAPGGGAAAAHTAAVAAALSAMVARLSARFADGGGATRWIEAADDADHLRDRLLQLAEDDAAAVRARDAEAATGVPLEVTLASARVAHLCRQAMDGHQPARSDAAVGVLLAAAAAAAAARTVRVNAGPEATVTLEAEAAAAAAREEI